MTRSQLFRPDHRILASFIKLVSRSTNSRGLSIGRNWLLSSNNSKRDPLIALAGVLISPSWGMRSVEKIQSRHSSCPAGSIALVPSLIAVTASGGSGAGVRSARISLEKEDDLLMELRCGDIQVLADFLCQGIVDFVVSRNGGRLPSIPVNEVAHNRFSANGE